MSAAQIGRRGTQPLIEALRISLDRQLERIPRRSPLAEAMRYGTSHWQGLCRFLEDGRVEIDTNVVERRIRPIALNRKNALFAGRSMNVPSASSRILMYRRSVYLSEAIVVKSSAAIAGMRIIAIM